MLCIMLDVLTNVSDEATASIFSVEEKLEAVGSSETFVSICGITRRINPRGQDLNSTVFCKWVYSFVNIIDIFFLNLKQHNFLSLRGNVHSANFLSSIVVFSSLCNNFISTNDTA
jgi:hypothetical protein